MVRLFILLLLAFPALTFADTIPAGFPSTPLWLSKTALTEGDSVTIHTVVFNSSTSSLSGSVVFLVDGAILGSKTFSVSPGTNELVSYPWTAKQGSHQFSARLDGVSGASDSLSSTATATTTVSVLAPPPPPESVTKTVEAANAVSETVQTATPIITNIASSTFATTEGIRESAVAALEKLASSTTHTTKPEGEVLGAEDYEAQMQANANKAFDIGATIQNMWQGLLSFLLMIFRSSFWFYVFVAAIIAILIAFVRTALSDRKYSR